MKGKKRSLQQAVNDNTSLLARKTNYIFTVYPEANSYCYGISYANICYITLSSGFETFVSTAACVFY